MWKLFDSFHKIRVKQLKIENHVRNSTKIPNDSLSLKNISRV